MHAFYMHCDARLFCSSRSRQRVLGTGARLISMKKRLMVSIVPAIACFAFAAPALAATQEAASENWAGYVATPNQASGFSGVSAQWKQPTVDCSTARQPTYSAYWVGLGGGGADSQA